MSSSQLNATFRIIADMCRAPAIMCCQTSNTDECHLQRKMELHGSAKSQPISRFHVLTSEGHANALAALAVATASGNRSLHDNRVSLGLLGLKPHGQLRQASRGITEVLRHLIPIIFEVRTHKSTEQPCTSPLSSKIRMFQRLEISFPRFLVAIGELRSNSTTRPRTGCWPAFLSSSCHSYSWSINKWRKPTRIDIVGESDRCPELTSSMTLSCALPDRTSIAAFI